MLIAVQKDPSSVEGELDVLGYPNLPLTSARVSQILEECNFGAMNTTTDREIVCLERLGLVAVLSERYFKHWNPVEAARKDLLKIAERQQGDFLVSADDKRDNLLNLGLSIRRKLSRLDHYPSSERAYTRHGNKRIALTRIGRALTQSLNPKIMQNEIFDDLWDHFTQDFATPFQRSALPFVINTLARIHENLDLAFEYTKFRWPGSHDLDKLYPELNEAHIQLNILLQKLETHPEHIGYEIQAPDVVLKAVRTFASTLEDLMEEIKPFIIEPAGIRREDHVQTDECDKSVKRNVIIVGRFLQRYAERLLGRKAIKVYM
ncbi:MAG: hypothetical protein R3A13_07390 [Bdellovibrionota bacterium]